MSELQYASSLWCLRATWFHSNAMNYVDMLTYSQLVPMLSVKYVVYVTPFLLVIGEVINTGKLGDGVAS